MEKSYTSYIKDAFSKYWDYNSLTDYPGEPLKYSDVARRIASMHVLFRDLGIKPGDKIALCGKNCSNWVVSYVGITTYGAVVVPLLHEFTPDNIQKISTHSDSRMLFVSDKIYRTLNPSQMSTIEAIVTLENMKVVYGKVLNKDILNEEWAELTQRIYTDEFRCEDFCSQLYEHGFDDLMVLNYTSGTTSKPKGVMIPMRAIASNIAFAQEKIPVLKPGDTLVSVLPMAHVYSMTFEFLFPFASGIFIHFLTQRLHPQYIVSAFREVKPRLIILVPLILEKIVTKDFIPKTRKTSVKALRHLPVVSGIINHKLRNEIIEYMGGNCYEIVVGGAALNKDIERFLLDIKFPLTVGYGMTECAPIIGFADWQIFRAGSCGQPAPRMEVKVDSDDPANVPGELLTRGENVMLGYYKNPDDTQRVMTDDGWLRTGDMAVIDKDQFIYIKGRCKTMLLGANGQNIYPEDIESLVNSNPYVQESLVVQRDNKLVCLVYPNAQNRTVAKLKDDPAALQQLYDKQRAAINKNLPHYEQVARFELVSEEFAKTAKNSIKRFMYK